MTDDGTPSTGTSRGSIDGQTSDDETVDGQTSDDRPTKRARIETTHGDTETARLVARALRPDNTAEMHTRVDGGRVVTVIERDSTGGLRTTVDDYVVNLRTGAQLATRDREPSTTETHDT